MPSPGRDPRQNPNDPRNSNKRAPSASREDDQRKISKDDSSTFSPRLESGVLGQTQEQISRVLTDFIAQSAELASLQTNLDQAEAQLKHATAEFELSQSDKYKNFAAIKEQAQLNKDRAEEKVNKARGAASKHRNSYERIVQILAGHICQGGRQDSAIAQHGARIEGQARDLSSLTSRVEEIDSIRITETEAKTAEFAQLRTHVDQDIARMSQQVKELQISQGGVDSRISRIETSQTAELSSHDAHITQLNMTTAKLRHRIDELSKGLEARIQKSLHDHSGKMTPQDEAVTSKAEAVEAKIHVMLNSFELRVQAYENDRTHFATRDEINDIKALSDAIRADIQELQQSRNLAASSTIGQASEPYGVASFSFAPPPSTEVAQVNGHNQQAAPASFAGEIAQLKAAVRNHRTRLDNMTTDQVVQAMLRQLEVLYPNAANTQQNFERLQIEHEKIRAFASRTREDVASLDATVFELRNTVNGLVNARQKSPSSDALVNLELNVGQLSHSLDSLKTRFDTAFAQLCKDLLPLQDRLAQAEVMLREQARAED
jgi:chromosome segregation ATPase